MPTHHLVLKSDSWLNGVINENTLVNSFHHQAAKNLAAGLTLDATSTDGVVEAFSDENRRIYAVQWHPEMLLMGQVPEAQALFNAFVGKI